MFFRVLAIALMLLTVGCQYDPYASEFTKKYPNERELTGTYHLDSDPSVRIVLRPDKTLTYDKIPDSVFADDGKGSGKTYTGKGTWRILQQQDWWAVLAEIDSYPPPKAPRGGYGMTVMIIGDDPPYTLHITLGDPDSGEALQFKK